MEPFDAFLESLLEKSEDDIQPGRRQEYAGEIERFLSRIETSTTDPLDIFKEILDLLKTIEMYIVREKRQEFMRHVKLALWNSHIALVDTLSEKAHAYTPEVAEIDRRWHELRVRHETWKRRFQLLSPSTPQDFEATLMWMAERGVEKDLDLLRDVENDLPYASRKIKQLLKIAKRRVRVRIYDPAKELQNKELQRFFNVSGDRFARITDTTDAIEKLRAIKESLEALFDPEEIKRWLRTPTSTFEGRTPIEIIIRGESDRILEILVRLEEGIHN